jgi:hypothetical protein
MVTKCGFEGAAVNASDILKYGHLTFLRSLEGLTDAHYTQGGVCGVWSVKDIIAHLASYELVLIDVLRGFLGGGATPYLDLFANADFNDAQVAARRDKSRQSVLDEYEIAHTRTMELIGQIPVETLRKNGTLPWYGAEYALDDFIVYAFYGHKREHSAQIYVFRDTL